MHLHWRVYVQQGHHATLEAHGASCLPQVLHLPRYHDPDHLHLLFAIETAASSNGPHRLFPSRRRLWLPPRQAVLIDPHSIQPFPTLSVQCSEYLHRFFQVQSRLRVDELCYHRRHFGYPPRRAHLDCHRERHVSHSSQDNEHIVDECHQYLLDSKPLKYFNPNATDSGHAESAAGSLTYAHSYTDAFAVSIRHKMH